MLTKILKQTSKYKGSSNKDNFLSFNIDENRQLLPIAEFRTKIDEYEQYLKEKDNCNSYNLIFTVNTVASNILFNNISEIVANEGGDNCVVFGKNGKKISESGLPGLISYTTVYKNISDSNKLNREDFIKDTSYSHKDLGKIVYHCGYDIFSNHLLRRNGFVVVNKIGDKIDDGDKKLFNTLGDYKRNYLGDYIADNINTLTFSGNSITTDTGKTNVHRYGFEDVNTIYGSISNNLVENNGWFGFINKSTLNVHNCVFSSVTDDTVYDLSINKVMNNNKPCEQIDLYPDRTLFYMKPKTNKLRNRVEYNWDYCITYPYENLYDNELIGETVTLSGKDYYFNGINCDLISPLDTLFRINSSSDTLNSDSLDNFVLKENETIYFRTDVRHNLNAGDTVVFYKFYEDENNNVISVIESGELNVVGVGYNNEYTENIFSIISNNCELLNFSEYMFMSGTTDGEIHAVAQFPLHIHFRIRKSINGYPCEYYIRKFKRLPNFKNTSYDNEFDKSNSIIDEIVLNGFSSSLNNLAFSTNIYGDPICQIIFNDDIITSGVYDNLKRPLSELYLTFVKTNRGFKKWYDEKKYTDSEIEFSHCFGDVTSGFDFLPYTDDYNVHKIHNINVESFSGSTFTDSIDKNTFTSGSVKETVEYFLGIAESVKNNENNESTINIKGDGFFGENKGIFFGDIVEYSPSEVLETTIEDVYFRFNTVQREYTKDWEFFDFNYEEIEADDYKLFDVSNGESETNGFKVSSETFNIISDNEEYNSKNSEGKRVFFNRYPFNLNPEGYFYKAHNRVQIKEYSGNVKQGNHTILSFSVNSGETVGKTFNVTMSKNYYLSSGTTLILYDLAYVTGKTISEENGVSGSSFSINHLVNDEYAPVYGNVESVSGKLGTYVTFTVKTNKNIDITNYRVFKYDIDKNSLSQELYDGNGTYLWREFKTDKSFRSGDELYNTMFTNGRKYLHNNINLFLRRQDPYGEYGNNFSGKDDVPVPSSILMLTHDGNYKDVSVSEEVNNTSSEICGMDITSELENAETAMKDGLNSVKDSMMKNVKNIVAIKESGKDIKDWASEFGYDVKDMFK